jgi:hypothetical protein
MIMMKSPSLAINSCDVPGLKYKMWRTIDAKPGMTANVLVHEIVAANDIALKLQHSPLLNVVINCHADHVGRLAIGGEGKTVPHLDILSVGVFGLLAGRNIGTIWLVACGAADGDKGRVFCKTLALVSGCQVVASDEDQEVGYWDSYRLFVGLHNQIDEFEGRVYSFTPRGPVTVIDPHEDIFTTLE